MTVASISASQPYPASSVILGVPLAVPFTVQAVAELAVRIGDRFQSVATIGVDYTVTLAADFSTASVTPTASLAGKAVVIERVTDARQQLVIQLGERLPERAITRELDRSALRDQELNTRLSRTIAVPPNEPGTVLPAAAARAGRLLAFDDTGAAVTLPYSLGTLLIPEEF